MFLEFPTESFGWMESASGLVNDQLLTVFELSTEYSE